MYYGGQDTWTRLWLIWMTIFFKTMDSKILNKIVNVIDYKIVNIMEDKIIRIIDEKIVNIIHDNIVDIVDDKIVNTIEDNIR